MSVFEPEQPGSVPATRSLPLVLRSLLDGGGGVTLLVGKVMAVPDGKHVDVEVAGHRVVIPGLAGYVPVVGEGCWCLMGSSIVLAIGSASGTRPTTVPSGTANGQVLVWNATLGAWQGQAKAPAAVSADSAASAASATAATRADQLGPDFVGSIAFLQRQPWGGTERAWWSKAGLFVSGGLGTVAHPLGRVPAFVSATTEGDRTVPQVGSINADASNIAMQFYTAAGGMPSNQNVNVWLLAIG